MRNLLTALLVVVSFQVTRPVLAQDDTKTFTYSQTKHGDEALGKAISPTLHLTKNSPPTLLLFGTSDVLFKQGEEFVQRSKELGIRAELFTAENQPHGFFHKSPWYEKTLYEADKFLVSLGYQGRADDQDSCRQR